MRKNAFLFTTMVLLAVGLSGCIESEKQLLPDSDAITSVPAGEYIANGEVGADGIRKLEHWTVSREGIRYRLQAPPKLDGKAPLVFGTIHPFDNQYVLFQYRDDSLKGRKYQYWLLSVRSNWVLINLINCDPKLLKSVGGNGDCEDIKSRNVLNALAKNAAKHPFDNPGISESSNLAAALVIQSAYTFSSSGISYLESNQFDRAIRNFDQAIKLDPNYIDALVSRCFARAIVGQLEQALTDCNESLRLKPNSVEAFENRGLTHLKLGQFEKAINDYDTALKIDRSQERSLYGRGLAKQKKGDSAGGGADIAAAKAIDEKIAQTFAGYGVN
jgi:tetratricopeptide (TPR) repeat protein